MFRSKPVGRTPKAGLDFVQDEQDAVAIAQAAQAIQITGRRNHVAALPQHRLDQHRGGLGGGGLGGEQVIQFLQTPLHGGPRLPTVAVGVREGRHEYARHQRLVAGAVNGLAGGQRHGADRAAVERALEDDHIGAAGGGPGQFQSSFHRLGPAVAEKEPIQAGVYDIVQRLDELQHGHVQGDVGLAVQQLAGLLPHRLDHSRVAVPGVGHADAAGEIQVGCPILGVQPAALAAVHDEVGVAKPDWREVAQGFLAHRLFLGHQSRSP